MVLKGKTARARSFLFFFGLYRYTRAARFLISYYIIKIVYCTSRESIDSEVEEYKNKCLRGHWVLVKESGGDLRKRNDKSLGKVRFSF